MHFLGAKRRSPPVAADQPTLPTAYDTTFDWITARIVRIVLHSRLLWAFGGSPPEHLFSAWAHALDERRPQAL